MQRDIRKNIAEYGQRFGVTKGKFYKSDVDQIAEISKYDPTMASFNALQAGFMIGYRAAKAEARRKNNA